MMLGDLVDCMIGMRRKEGGEDGERERGREGGREKGRDEARRGSGVGLVLALVFVLSGCTKKTMNEERENQGTTVCSICIQSR